MTYVEFAIDRNIGDDPKSITVHLFDGSQDGAKTGDDTYRTICGLTFAASRCRVSRGENICQQCTAKAQA